MVKYRFCYAKYGDARFISHLDLIRLFSRAFRRGGIPLTHSEGFNPHPKMTIGLPLPVGMTSSCEYMDAETDRPLSQQDVERLNSVLPMGVCIHAVAEIGPNTKKMADIRWAGYRVSFSGCSVTEEQIELFLKRETVEIEKKTKRKTEMTDILPDIMELTLGDDHGTLLMTLSAGSAASLKPDLVLAAMAIYIPGFAPSDYSVHREQILSGDGKPLL